MAVVPELKEQVRRLFYPAYESRMVKALPKDRIPQHIGVMLDGNRRWAKGVGEDSTHGYRAGAANIEPLLEWSEEVGVRVVTLWLLRPQSFPARGSRRLESSSSGKDA